MTYFELFNIPLNLFPDLKEIKSKFYELSKIHHPDINQSSDPADYVKSLEMSGLVNQAYKTLSDFDHRLKYILDCVGALTDPNEQLSPDFLMEMMELNEVMMEASDDPVKKQQFLADLDFRETEQIDQLTKIWDSVDSGTPSADQIEQLKKVYFERKYLLRIRKNLNSFAEL